MSVWSAAAGFVCVPGSGRPAATVLGVSVDITYDFGQLDRFATRLRELDDRAALAGLVEGLADLWVDVARQRMGKDTRQLFNRTGVTYVGSSAGRADAIVEADTPYAGYHNYGNRYTPPNGFWNAGRDHAEQRARQLDGVLNTQIRRSLTSGGSWNPRDLI